MAQSKQPAGGRDLSTREIIAFGAVVWPLVIGQQSLAFMVPYYAQVIGLPLATLGLIYALGRIFDAAWDTGIAFISDNTKSRYGRRKPWIVAGTVLFLPAMWFLFIPGPEATLAHYGWAMFFFFTAWTMAYIPVLSQATELSDDYVTRNSITLTQSVVTSSSLLAASLLPLVLLDQRFAGFREHAAQSLGFLRHLGLQGFLDFLNMPTITGPGRYGPIMKVVVIATSIVMPFTLLAYMLLVKEKPVKPNAPKGSITAAIKNVLFQRFFGGYGLMMLGYMGKQGLTPFIVAFALGATDNLLFFLLLTNITGIVCTPIWSWLLRRFERVTIVMAAGVIEASGLLLLALCRPGDSLLMNAAFVLMGVPGLTIMLVPYQIAGDCADFAKWKSRKESRAVHVSLISLTKKFGSIWAAGSVAVAGLLGFNPKMAEVPPETVDMLRVLGLVTPAVLLLVGALVIWRFPMTRRRQRALRTRLDRRDAADDAAPEVVIAGAIQPAI